MFYSPLEQFEITPILSSVLPSKLIITNSTFFLCLTLVITILFFTFILSNSTLIPNRWQSITEMTYEFVQNMLYEALKERGNYFFPIIFTMFTFVFACNLLGMVPFTFTVTSHIIFTFSLGMIIFVGLNIIGLKQHGLHFFSLFLPPGSPLMLALLLVPIELISYVFRVVALSVRLFANMMAGHTLLKILATFAWKMLTIGGIFLIIQLFPLMIIIAITGLELAIAFLQAYVWTTLICLYLSDALNLH
ncbi:ATP synthase F0 subunit 6 (mitochondrion) [Hemiselmis andersenii]|uniref:ATP synthase subunit a n=1 Tax=Hemiselmis andersenii TaxID=464988 RepID=B2MWT7_HEMAN|nr:ATP synthase F0 subunit 6 [Hemiselmis andersenii]ACC78229.1 ATP synthase F0 subunit 6 [Hemiselmis andersenii]